MCLKCWHFILWVDVLRNSGVRQPQGQKVNTSSTFFSCFYAFSEVGSRIIIIKLAELDKNIIFSTSRIVANQFKNKLKFKFVFELVRDNSRHRKCDILVKLGELDDSDAALTSESA